MATANSPSQRSGGADAPTPPSERRRSSPRSGELLAIVDTGPLYAVADADDRAHLRCREALERPDLELVVPTLVVAEATYLVGSRLGASAEAHFLRGLSVLEIEPPAPTDWDRIAGLVDQYADLGLGGTDASIVALAERLDAATLITLDHRHLGTVRPAHRSSFELLP